MATGARKCPHLRDHSTISRLGDERAHDKPALLGDNLDILRNDIRLGSVDLVYLDPPFNSQAITTFCLRRIRGTIGGTN